MQDNNIGGDPNNNQTGGIKVKSGDVPKSTTNKRGPIYFSESALPNTSPPPPNMGKTSDMGRGMGSGKPGTPDQKGQPVSQGTTPITPPIPNPIITTNEKNSSKGNVPQAGGSGGDGNAEIPSSVGSSPKPSVPQGKKKKNILKILIVLFMALLVVSAVFLIPKLFKNKVGGEEQEIVWWGLWEDGKNVKPLIDEYQEKNPKIKIKYIKQSKEDYRERLMSAMAKGDAPDIFRFHNTWVPMLGKELDNVPASVMGVSDYVQTFFPVVVSDVTKGSSLVGIPLGYDALTLFINEDLFRNENLDPPKTWVELEKDAKILTKVENGVIKQAGVALGRTENIDHWPEIVGLMLIQNGVNMSKMEGKLVEGALMFYTAFSRVNHVWDETLPSSTSAFASGKLAMYFGPSWRAFNIREVNPDLNFRTVSLPQVPKENPNEPNVSYATYWVEGVWARSENKDAAWDFLKFISSKESLEKLYKNESVIRGFGEAYPRKDMSNLLLEHPVLGSVISLALEAQSWYLADRTFDGPTGINSQINKYFEDAINALNKGDQIDSVMPTLTEGVKQVLSQYRLVRR